MNSLYSLEYEKLLLGAILLDNTLLEEADLRADYFYAPGHQAAYTEIVKMVNSGAVADQQTLFPILGGGVFDLDAPTTANFAFYASALKELFLKRRVHALSVNITENALSATSGALIAKIEQELVSIATDASCGYQSADLVLPGVVQMIEDAWHRKGALSGIPTKIPRLDSLTDGLQKQELIIVGARPGSGKTALALHLADAACEAGYAVGFFSAEMASTYLLRRLLSRESGVSQGKLKRGYLTNEDFASITDANARIYERRLFLDDTPNIALDRLISSARRMKRKEGIDLLIIDYIGLITHHDQSIPRHEQVREISKMLKGLARELAVPVVALAQLNRETEGKRPTLANLRDSGALEQDADVVLFLWRREDRGDDKRKVTLILEKQRNGPVGSVDLLFDTGRMRFAELGGDA